MIAGRWSGRVPHKIALNFEDGTTQFIDADESETIADAAYRQGINVPLDCNQRGLRHLQGLSSIG
jgi:hypothetical protein